MESGYFVRAGTRLAGQLRGTDTGMNENRNSNYGSVDGGSASGGAGGGQGSQRTEQPRDSMGRWVSRQQEAEQPVALGQESVGSVPQTAVKSLSAEITAAATQDERGGIAKAAASAAAEAGKAAGTVAERLAGWLSPQKPEGPEHFEIGTPHLTGATSEQIAGASQAPDQQIAAQIAALQEVVARCCEPGCDDRNSSGAGSCCEGA